MPRAPKPKIPDDAEAHARQSHRDSYNAVWAHKLLTEAIDRTLPQRIDAGVVAAIHHIEAEAKRERAGTVLDFVRADVRNGVHDELRRRGFRVEESLTRSCAEPGGDAVASLVVRW